MYRFTNDFAVHQRFIIRRMFIEHIKTMTVHQQYFESFLIRGWGVVGGDEEGGGT